VVEVSELVAPRRELRGSPPRASTTPLEPLTGEGITISSRRQLREGVGPIPVTVGLFKIAGLHH